MKPGKLFFSIFILLILSLLPACASQTIRSGKNELKVDYWSNLLNKNEQPVSGKLDNIPTKPIPYLSKGKIEYNKDFSIYSGKILLLIPVGKREMEIENLYEYCPRGGIVYTNPGTHFALPSFLTLFTLPILYHEVGIEISCK